MCYTPAQQLTLDMIPDLLKSEDAPNLQGVVFEEPLFLPVFACFYLF